MGFLLFAFGIYFFLHSYLANERVKGRLEKFLRLSTKGYRKGYNLLNLVALIFLLMMLYSIPSPLLYATNAAAEIIGILGVIAGIIMMVLSVRNYDLIAFFGFRNGTRMPLRINGLHKYIRHPLYTGTILLMIGICIAFPYVKNGLFLILSIIYIVIGIHYEEKKLVVWFGEEYKSYQRKVKKLIPGVI
jgi:protein-S-isoprenylcysteine O-methyltransferase Ste14